MTHLVEGKLWAKILVGMALGVVLGVALGPSAGLVPPATAKVLGNWVALPGELFLVLLRMIVVPLIFASIIRGLASSEDVEHLRTTGLRLLFYFVFTTAVAITLGMGLAWVTQPGQYVETGALASLRESVPQVPAGDMVPTVSTAPQFLLHMLPANPLGAMLNGEMIQIVLFSVIVGVALLNLRPGDSKPLLDLLGSVQQVCMTVMGWAMAMAPVAVLGLMTRITSQVGLEVLRGLAMYMATVLVGLCLLMVFYLVVLRTLGGKQPGEFLRAARDAQILAFSTSSSAAVMPLSLQTAEDRLGVRPTTARLIIPLGATINMDGTALYQGVATVFLAQVFGAHLGVTEVVLVVVTAVLASIGAPATPGAGIVILGMVLEGVGVPAAGIGLIIGVDRLLDMSRTVLNVTGDLTACAVMDRWIGGKHTAEEQLVHQEQLERRRRDTGEDVVVTQPKG